VFIALSAFHVIVSSGRTAAVLLNKCLSRKFKRFTNIVSLCVCRQYTAVWLHTNSDIIIIRAVNHRPFGPDVILEYKGDILEISRSKIMSICVKKM